MFKYAQLSDENVVIGISELSSEVIADNMILINNLDIITGSTYNRTTGEFIPPEPQPIPQPQPTLEEQMAKLRDDNLILMNALAMTFEEVMILRAEIGGKE